MKFSTLILIIFYLNSSFALEITSALESYKENENFKNAINEIEIFQAREDGTFGNVLPTLELNSNYTKQSATNNSFVGSEQRQSFITLRQPLFRGLSEFNALDYAEKLSETKKLAKEVIKRELQLQIADQFMQAYGLQKEISLFKELVIINTNNFKLIKEREKIGKSKKSDLLRAQANLLQIKAQLTQLNEQLETSLIDLQRLTNKRSDNLKYIDIKKMDNFTVDTHPSVKVARLLFEASDDLIASSKGNHYPQLDFNANYYLEQEGVFNERDWDMAVNLTIPIYEGGRTSSQIREQELLKKRNALILEQTKRDLETMLKKLNTQSTLLNQQLRAYELSVKASYESYREILKDYKLRLTTNLDLNNALESYLQEKRNLISLDTKKKFIHLQEIIIKGLN